MGLFDNTQVNENLYLLLFDFIGDYGAICKQLRDTNSVISGGSILKVLTNNLIKDKTVKTADIDLYVPQDHYFEWLRFLKHFNYRPVIKYDSKNMHPYLRVPSIDSVTALKRKNDGQIQKIDLIVSSNNPIECIKDYDFKFLLSYFDGTQLNVVCPSSIINKTSNVNTRIKYLKPTRVKKYTEYGYNIVTDRKYRSDYTPLFRFPYKIPITSPKIDYNLLIEIRLRQVL